MLKNFTANLVLAIGVSFLFVSGCAAQATQVQQNQLSAGAAAVQQTQTLAQTDDNQTAAVHPAMANPELATETAPAQYKVKVTTTKGDFVIQVKREWSPNGADRFFNLVKIGYFDEVAIFRAIPNFMFQFGIHGDPAVNETWGEATIKDDAAAGVSNLPGRITFAKTGFPDSRSTQFFINLQNNQGLDGQGFTPFGEIVEGMDVAKKINTQYGENPRSFQGDFKAQGNEYVKAKYPNVDYIRSMSIVAE